MPPSPSLPPPLPLLDGGLVYLCSLIFKISLPELSKGTWSQWYQMKILFPLHQLLQLELLLLLLLLISLMGRMLSRDLLSLP